MAAPARRVVCERVKVTLAVGRLCLGPHALANCGGNGLCGGPCRFVPRGEAR